MVPPAYIYISHSWHFFILSYTSKYAVTTAVLPSCPFSLTCVTLGISIRTHPEGETCITMHKCIFLALRNFVLFRPWVFPRALGSVAGREQAGTPPGPRAQVWALAEVHGTCSVGLKWQVPSGRNSEHVESSRPMQTHVHST